MYLRQQDIFMPNKDIKISVIGAGGIGSWTALGLSKIGFKDIEVWDGDTIEEHNIPNQLFKLYGLNKAEELKNELGIKAISKFWDGELLDSDIIILAVDNMEIRKKIVESQTASLIIDGRIGGEMIRIFSVSPICFNSREYFLSLWHPSSEAIELPCTARNIADVGFFVGGFICNLVRKFLKDNIVYKEIIFDVKNLELLKIN